MDLTFENLKVGMDGVNPHAQKNNTTGKSIESYFDDIEIYKIQKLVKLYDADYKAFSYDYPQFIQKIIQIS